MNAEVIFTLLFLICAVIISYQDFKNRLISIWAIVIYWILSISAVLILKSGEVLLSNFISAGLYFLFSFLVLVLYYYIRQKRLIAIIDSKIGLGDVLLLPAIGMTFEPLNMILFFASGFILCAVAGIFFARKSQTIPLAGLMVCWHFIFLVTEDYLPDLSL